jgi:hypothetical protein
MLGLCFQNYVFFTVLHKNYSNVLKTLPQYLEQNIRGVPKYQNLLVMYNFVGFFTKMKLTNASHVSFYFINSSQM